MVRSTIVIILLHMHLYAKGQISDTLYYTLSWKEFYTISALHDPINIQTPDYALLDAAIFHATNERREQEHFPGIQYLKALHQAAALHSSLMIKDDFYNHYNTHNRYFYFPLDRIREFDQKIPLIAENIAEYPLLISGKLYCAEKNTDGTYSYFDYKTLKPLKVYTYLEFAKKVVDNWMNSPSHRKNIFNKDYTYLGCAARFSANSFKDTLLPFARLTQNFGGY